LLKRDGKELQSGHQGYVLGSASPGCSGKRFPIAPQAILASKSCVIRIALLFGALCLSANAGELASVITAQKSFVNAATELERHIGDFHSPEELAAGMQEYLRAKKQLQDELEKELPELKAQIAHRKLPTPEGLALGLHLNDFPAERLQHLETTLLTNLEKDASQQTPANALAELNWLQERGTRIYKELM
jgi:hypothetical protein